MIKEKPWAVELYGCDLLVSHLARSFETIDEASDKSVRLTQTLSDEAFEAGARWCVVHNTFYKHGPAPNGPTARPSPPDQTVEEWLDWLVAPPGASEYANAPGATDAGLMALIARRSSPDDDRSGIEWAKNCLAFWEEKRREKEPKTTIWPAPPANPIPLLTYSPPYSCPHSLAVIAIYPAPTDYGEDTYLLLLQGSHQAACSGAYLDGLCSYWPMFLENYGEGQ